MLVPVYTSDCPSGDTPTRVTQINGAINHLLAKSGNKLIDICSLSDTKDPETWSGIIIQALLGNLIYNGSQYGQFGTPDNDILQAIQSTHQSRWVWVKILGTKMDLLISLGQGKLPDTQLHRIIAIQAELKKIFTKPHQVT